MTAAVLVIGASGFIGRHLTEAIAARGADVVAATRRPCSFDDPRIVNATDTFDTPASFMPFLERCSVVVHAASSSSPASSVGAPLTELDKNLRSLLALVAALQHHADRRLVYLSSAGTLYGDCDERADEDHPLCPRSYHGAAKAAAEHFLRAWSDQYGGNATILRPSNVYGPGQHPREGFGVIPAAFEAATHGNEFTVWGDGGSIRDYLYIDDLVDACLRAITLSTSRRFEIFNVCQGVGFGLSQLLDAIDATTGTPLLRRHQPSRRTDIRRIVPSNDHAHMTLGWSPMVPLEEGLRRTWRWFSTRS